MVKNKLTLFVLLCISTISTYANATAIAKLDRTTISENETVQLSITIDETNILSSPDVSLLNKDFDVLGSNKSSQTSWVNGKKSAQTTWVYQLAPKHAGVFTIPAIEVDNQQTQAISIQVKPADNNPVARAGVEPVFMEVSVNKDSVYVQEQILLTVRVNSAVNLNDMQVDDLQLEDAFVKQLNNTQYQRNINGIPHITIETVYAIFPQTSGTLNIPAIMAAVVVPTERQSRGFGSFFNQGKTLRIRSNPLNISVNEIPSTLGANDWLPAENLQLQESWSSDPTEVKLGDSITRTITTTAVGLSAEQIPPIIIEPNKKFKSYPDQPEFEDKTSDMGVTGIRKDAIALVATQPGEITLPEITVQWWDITDNTLKKSTLPEITINVMGTLESPAPVATNPSPQLEPTAESPNTVTTIKTTSATDISTLRVWQTTTVISSTLALVFLLLFLHTRKKTTAVIDIQEAQPTNNSTEKYLKELKIACSNRDIHAIRSSVLHWAQLTWPRSALHSTIDVARQFNDENFSLRMKKLDAALFSGEDSLENWQGLYEQIEAKHQKINVGKTQKLAPLYPVS